MVDSSGRPATPDDEQTHTQVVRSGETVAVLAHRRPLEVRGGGRVLLTMPGAA